MSVRHAKQFPNPSPDGGDSNRCYGVDWNAEHVVSLGLKAKEASYIILNDNGTIKAINGSTGAIDFSGTDAATVIQAAINALPSHGKIFIKKGYYVCNSPINVTSLRSVTIEGECIAHYPFNNPEEGTTLYKNFDGTLIDARYPSSDNYAHSINLKNLAMVGKNSGYYSNYATGPAIHVTYANGFTFENVRILRFETGIKFEHVSWHRFSNVVVSECKYHGFDIYDTWDALWDNVESCDNQQDAGYSAFYLNNCNIMINNIHAEGFRAISHVGGGVVHLNNVFVPWSRERSLFLQSSTIINNGYFYGGNTNGEFTGDAGATIFADAATHLFISNSIVDLYSSEATYSIRCTTGGAATVAHLVNCVFQKPVILHNDAKVTNCFFISSFTSYANSIIIGNKFVSSVYVGSGIVKHNIGYVTENSGTATFSGDGSTTTFNIPHGLASTPKSYHVEAGSADAKGDKYVTADATNLTVTFATAPPAGTNNVVLVWSAEV
jgi:hypothetical protein